MDLLSKQAPDAFPFACGALRTNMNADHKLIIVYGKTLDELCQKYDEAEQRSENDAFNRRSPTVKEYCEKWLLMQSAHIRETNIDQILKIANAGGLLQVPDLRKALDELRTVEKQISSAYGY